MGTPSLFAFPKYAAPGRLLPWGIKGVEWARATILNEEGRDEGVAYSFIAAFVV